MTVSTLAAWRTRAACASSPEPWLWDATVHGETVFEQRARHDTAITICDACPVRDACRADVDPERDEGIRGGILLHELKGKGQRDFRHGTEAGAASHRRRGQTPCRACADAVNRARAERARRAGRKQRHSFPCGTHAAYKRHKRRGEQACQPCLDARAAYDRARKTTTRQEVPA